MKVTNLILTKNLQIDMHYDSIFVLYTYIYREREKDAYKGVMVEGTGMFTF